MGLRHAQGLLIPCPPKRAVSVLQSNLVYTKGSCAIMYVVGKKVMYVVGRKVMDGITFD